jgi:hypothetical protein
MQTYILQTGFWYLKDTGGNVVEIHFNNEVGQTVSYPDGFTLVEVANADGLSGIAIPQSQEQITALANSQLLLQIQANREAYIDALINNDAATQASIVTAQTALISQAVTAGVALPPTTTNWIQTSGVIQANK